MLNPLLVKCPKCEETCELFLASNPYMMVLNCPSCRAHLLHCEGKTYEIDDVKIVRLEKQQITQFVDNIKSASPLALPAAKSPGLLPGSRDKGNASRARHRVGQPVRTKPISADDLLNLRIDLEITRDISEFLKKI